MNDLDALIRLSRYAGERFDLVQGGGGNTSVQLTDGSMLVKASGCLLSQVSTSRGFVKVSRQAVLDLLEDPSRNDLSGLDVMPASVRPSIEVYFHAMLGAVTLHTHPVVVNSLVCRLGWRDVISRIFPGALMVNYQTPGLKVALALKAELARTGWRSSGGPAIVFLQNHGLIVSGGSCEEVIALHEGVLLAVEKFLGFDMAPHRHSGMAAALMGEESLGGRVVYRCQDEWLRRMLRTGRQAFFKSPVFPDGAVFFGAGAVKINDPGDDAPIRDYEREHGGHPVVLVLKDDIFFAAKDPFKAREIESVFKAHVMVLSMGRGDIQFLSRDEVAFLGNWEAEKYRREGK